MKVRGQDFIDFYIEWPMGMNWCIGELSIDSDDGEASFYYINDDGDHNPVEPGEEYTLWGYLDWQGEGPKPNDYETKSRIEWWFRRWLKAKTTASFVVEVPKAEEEAAKKICREYGWKVR